MLDKSLISFLVHLSLKKYELTELMDAYAIAKELSHLKYNYDGGNYIHSLAKNLSLRLNQPLVI